MSGQPLSPKDSLPTPFTIALGQRIHEARGEHGFSQFNSQIV
jgi:hypothetical protein